MLIFSYNEGTLFSILNNKKNVNKKIENFGNITTISDLNGKLLGINFHFFDLFELKNGPVFMSENEIEILNVYLNKNGIDFKFDEKNQKHLIVGKITNIEKYEKSDHLNIITVNIGNGKEEKLISGSFNPELNKNVIVALDGTITPAGEIITKGKLRDFESNGMILSGIELNLTGEKNKKGMYFIDNEFEAGTIIDYKILNNI